MAVSDYSAQPLGRKRIDHSHPHSPPLVFAARNFFKIPEILFSK
jgi:hypothetical protein